MSSIAALAEPTFHPPFDRRSIPVYALIGMLALVGTLLLSLRGFYVSPAVWSGVFAWPLLTIAGGLGLRRIGWPRFGGAMEATGILYGQGLASFLCLVPLATLSAPFADNWLAAADRALGFDWVAYAHATVSWHDTFARAYKSFMWQPAMVAFALFPFGQCDRGWRAVLAATIAMTLTAMLFPFAPAIGSSLHYGVAVVTPAQPFAQVLTDLKDGVRVLDTGTFKGLVSFPSYHAAAATIFSWGCWTTKLRWPVIALNIVVCMSAITMGSHYLVDILAGIAVGAAAIAAAGWVYERGKAAVGTEKPLSLA